MKTKDKIIFVSSSVLFIATSFIVASMIFLQDKKSIYDARDGDIGAFIEDKTDNMNKTEQTNNENFEKTLDPNELIEKEVRTIIDDVEKQETSLETEVNYFN